MIMSIAKISLIPRFRGGSFEFVATTLCKFFKENGYDCVVEHLNIKKILEPRDIVIFLGNINDSSIVRATLVSTLSKLKIFYAVTEGPYFGYLKPLSRIFTIVVPSSYVKKELEDSGLRVRTIIPHGIDVKECKINFARCRELIEEIREIMTLKRAGYIVLLSVVSEDIPRKGLKYLYNALRIARTSKPFKLVIKGSVSHPQDLTDKVIIVRRFLSREDLIMLYNSVDACIVPSLAEGFGLPIIECFAAGKPVISLNAPPMNEINSDKTGWLVKVDKQEVVKSWPSSYRLNIPDIYDYALKIAECVNSDELRLEKGINALKRAYLYDYRHTYKYFLNLISDIGD